MLAQPPKRNDDYAILHTFVNRHKQVESRKNAGLTGCTEQQAISIFDQHVRFAKIEGRTWQGVPVNILSVVLVDADDNVLAQWHKPVESEVA